MLTFFFVYRNFQANARIAMKLFKLLLAFLLTLSLTVLTSAQDGFGDGGAAVAQDYGSPQAGKDMGGNAGYVASSTYQIQPLDELTVRLFVADTLQFAHQIRVSGDGTVSLPYLGPVPVQNLTIEEIRQRLFEPYNRDYYVNPQIDVRVVSYSSRSVEVMGKVNRQGTVRFPSEEPLYLIQAISLAGGWSNDQMADKSNVKITRKDANGNTTTLTVNANNLTTRDFPLQNGDVVFVERRIW